jgi:uncharacterized protein
MSIDVNAVPNIDHDGSLPLDVRFGNQRRCGGGSTVHDVSYASPEGHGRVSAYWVSPSGPGPFSANVFVHPGPGSRDSFLNEALLLASHEIASLLVEAPWAQGEAWGRTMGEPAHDLQEHSKTAIDLRRGIDFAASRPEVAAGRIGYVGHSFGALFGGLLADVDRRLRAFVLMAGVGSFADVAAANIPTLKGPALQRYRQALAPIEPRRFVGSAAPAALFFQLARRDKFSRDLLLAYADAGSQPKRIEWYDADHYSLSEVGCNDRVAWTRERLSQ